MSLLGGDHNTTFLLSDQYVLSPIFKFVTRPPRRFILRVYEECIRLVHLLQRPLPDWVELLRETLTNRYLSERQEWEGKGEGIWFRRKYRATKNDRAVSLVKSWHVGVLLLLKVTSCFSHQVFALVSKLYYLRDVNTEQCLNLNPLLQEPRYQQQKYSLLQQSCYPRHTACCSISVTQTETDWASRTASLTALH